MYCLYGFFDQVCNGSEIGLNGEPRFQELYCFCIWYNAQSFGTSRVLPIKDQWVIFGIGRWRWPDRTCNGYSQRYFGRTHVLSRELTNRNQYPAIDVLTNVSRSYGWCSNKEHTQISRQIKVWQYIKWRFNKYWRMLKSSADIDFAIEHNKAILDFIQRKRHKILLLWNQNMLKVLD